MPFKFREKTRSTTAGQRIGESVRMVLDYGADQLKQVQVRDIIVKSVWERSPESDACVLYNIMLESGRSQLQLAKTWQLNIGFWKCAV